jgi:hypothetical protein
MGIDFLDCRFRIEREFGLVRGDLDGDRFEVRRDARGVMVGATAGDVARWVEACMAARGKEPPVDLWPRVRACIAATVAVPVAEVTPDSRMIEDLGYT